MKSLKIKGLKLPLPPQYNTGSLIGSALFIYGQGMGLVGILSTLMGAGTWYVVSTGRWPELSVVPIWGFFLILAVILTMFMLFAYMVVVPSSVAFGNSQWYKHDNPVKADMKEVMERLDKIEKLLIKGG